MNLPGDFRTDVAPGVAPKTLDFALEKIFLTRVRLRGLRLELGQLDTMLAKVLLENAGLYIDANDELPAVGDTGESLLQLTYPLTRSCAIARSLTQSTSAVRDSTLSGV